VVGEKHPEEDCFWRREPEGRRDDGDNPDRQADLEHPADEHPLLHLKEALEREFHADGEEEEYDTEFCEDLHICSICDEAEAVGPGNDAGKEERHDPGHLQPVAEGECPDGEDEYDQDLFKKGRIHGGFLAVMPVLWVFSVASVEARIRAFQVGLDRRSAEGSGLRLTRPIECRKLLLFTLNKNSVSGPESPTPRRSGYLQVESRFRATSQILNRIWHKDPGSGVSSSARC